MELCVDAKQLRRALVDIEKAEANGFNHCLAVLKIVSAGKMLDQNRVEYSDIYEKAHPTIGKLDWGRGQNVTGQYKFVDGKLISIDGKLISIDGKLISIDKGE